MAAPLRDTERARIRAAFVMGSMVAAWMRIASPAVVYMRMVIATAQMVLVQCMNYEFLMSW